MMYEVVVDPQVSARFPHYGCVVAYASNLVNRLRNVQTDNGVPSLKEVEAGVRARFADVPPSADSHIAAWRAAYSSFGAKPGKYLCSVEALISRILESGGLPDISPVVNAYNKVSLQHLIPVGGEDWDALASNNVLRLSNGCIPFETLRLGEKVIETPPPGEVIWADEKGVTCRRWNWRQCHRTLINEMTNNAYFVFDVLPPFHLTNALLAAEDLHRELRSFSPNLTFRVEIAQAPTPN